MKYTVYIQDTSYEQEADCVEEAVLAATQTHEQQRTVREFVPLSVRDANGQRHTFRVEMLRIPVVNGLTGNTINHLRAFSAFLSRTEPPSGVEVYGGEIEIDFSKALPEYSKWLATMKFFDDILNSEPRSKP